MLPVGGAAQTIVGTGDGVAAGDGVGKAVGAWVGLGIGVAVGAWVGLAVADGTGDGVGSWPDGGHSRTHVVGTSTSAETKRIFMATFLYVKFL